MRKVMIAVAFLLVAFSFCFAQSNESITITTYYPSPFGNYHELHSDGISVGAGNRTQGPPLNGLIVQGDVGIGVTAPTAKLDVNGNLNVNGSIKITDGSQSLGAVLASDANGLAHWQTAPVPLGTWVGLCIQSPILAPATCTVAGGTIYCNGVWCECPVGYMLAMTAVDVPNDTKYSACLKQ